MIFQSVEFSAFWKPLLIVCRPHVPILINLLRHPFLRFSFNKLTFQPSEDIWIHFCFGSSKLASLKNALFIFGVDTLFTMKSQKQTSTSIWPLLMTLLYDSSKEITMESVCFTISNKFSLKKEPAQNVLHNQLLFHPVEILGQ